MTHYPSATIPITEVRTLHSSAVDQDYVISVAVPTYYAEEPGKTYPVIYLLDANLYFGMVTEMVRAMTIRVDHCGDIPEVIVVGIGYPMSGSPVESFA